MSRIDASKYDLKEKVVTINRVAKVVKGGRRFSFSVLVVVGNGQGIVGAGTGKASEVPDAVKKAVEDAKKNLIEITLNGSTLYHEITGVFKSSRVLMKPATPGTGVIAGGGVRAVCDLAGLHDVLTKSIKSDNTFNVVQATIAGLKACRSPQAVAALRGRTVEEIVGTVKP